MLVPQRNYQSPAYRYGFQGQEKDDEIKGPGNSLNYKFRMHDPRVGRFFASDPLEARFPWNSSYAFSENRVIRYAELEGAEVFDPMIGFVYLISTKIVKMKAKFTNGIDNSVQAATIDKLNIAMSAQNVETRNELERKRSLKLIKGINNVLAVVEDGIILGAETVNTIPGVDTVGDPLLALYFTKKALRTGDLNDKIDATSYSLAMFVPLASGVVIKLSGRGVVHLLKKSAKYDFKIAGKIRNDIIEAINDPKLKDAFSELYRPNGSIGNGGTAAAVIEEGVGGTHWQKAHDKLKQLTDLTQQRGKYKKNVLNNDDQKIANQLIEELKGAIETAKKNSHD